ncbi:MAG: accessory factor UbiK family protein [Pseudohongiellaceae bacterium]
MLDNEFLHLLSAKAAALFPAAQAARAKLEQELYALLQTSLGKLNVVTREEFTAQQHVLEKATLQIFALEQKLAELEQHQQ